jgi:VWFA-related protein
MARRFRLKLSLCLAAAALVLLVSSQGLPQSTPTQPPTPQASAPALKVTSRLVQVNVIVRRRGAPVTGLTKDDFTILDQGRTQQIADFSEQFYNPTAAPRTASAANDSNSLFSNHFDPNAGTPNSVTVILLDALNTPRQQMANARAEVASFLHQLQPTDRVALYGLSTDLYVLHSFTNDAASLLAALAKSKNTNAYQPSAADVAEFDTGNDNLDAFMESAEQHAADMKTINRAEMTANVMAAIANSLVNVPGRKNLVWVSGAFPFQIGTGSSADDPQANSAVPAMGGSTPNNSNAAGPDNSVQFRTFVKELEAASEAVNNANLAIYPVDARGLIGASNVSADVERPMPRPGSSGARSRRPTTTNQASPPRDNFNTMDELAERTGGHAFYNTNDIQHSIRQAIDDSRDSYVLDYYPSDTQWDGSFHTIKVEVRSPGAEVRFRKGYFAMSDASSDPLRVEQTMQDAMSSPFQDADFGLAIEAHPKDPSNGRALSLLIEMDSNHMRFKQLGENWNDEIQIVWMQFAANGKLASGLTQRMTVTLSQQSYQETQHTSVKLWRDVALKDAAVKLRVVVRDISTGAVGSVDIQLQKVFSPSGAAPPTK